MEILQVRNISASLLSQTDQLPSQGLLRVDLCNGQSLLVLDSVPHLSVKTAPGSKVF
jgi:hypothetical protein